MKYKILALVIAVCVTCISGISSFADDYSLTNGGFETGYTGTYLPGWSFGGGSFNDGFYLVEGGNTGVGNCLKIVKGTAATYAYTAKAFDFAEGEMYGISMWALNMAGTGISFKVELYDQTSISGATRLDGDSMSKPIGTSDEWQNIKYSFIAPAGCKLLVIYLCNYASEGSTVYFDNLTFGAGDFLSNSDMELSSGTVPTGWGTNGTVTSWYKTDDAQGAHSGSSYAAIDGTGNPSLYYAGIPVKGNARYKLSFFYKYTKKSQEGAPRITVYYGTNQGSAWGMNGGILYSSSTATYGNSISPCPENTWIKCTYYLLTPAENCSYLAIHLIGYSNWISCYDDIKFEADKNYLEICNNYGDEIKTLTTGSLYARGRYIPDGNNGSTKLILASYLVEKGVKTLISVDIQSAETSAGAPLDIEAEIDIEQTENIIVQAYLWDTLPGIKILSDKISL